MNSGSEKDSCPFIFVLLVFVIASCNSVKPPPNIIIIMADDLGYGELGCYGNNEIQTPNLDYMAAQGIRFTDFHSNGAVCTPTRAALMTGRYQQRCGLEGVIYVRGETRQLGMDTSEITLPQVLKANGYATAIMGKWHLGYQKEYNPVYHGFDEFIGYVSGNIDYHSHYDNAGIYDWFHNTDTILQEGYVTDLITQNSIDFIRANRQKPFFLYVAHEAPHAPMQGRDDPAYRFPDQEFDYYGPVIDQHRAYREMNEVMDEGIGEILATLDELKLEENTLLFFLSDNGPESKFGKNGPLSGYKTELLEGGHRVPAIAYWKGTINPAVSRELLMSFDLFPTALAMAGITVHKSAEIDGLDFSPLFFGHQILPERTLFWRYRGNRAVRNNDWKLMVTDTDTALYNLNQDLEEQTNLVSTELKLKDDLLTKLQEWEQDINTVSQKTR